MRSSNFAYYKSEILYDFYYGNLDYNCYQSKAWRRCLLEACDWTAAQKAVVYSEPEGLPALRHELANYLHFSRGVRCLADQIILTGGHQHSLAMSAIRAVIEQIDRNDTPLR